MKTLKAVFKGVAIGVALIIVSSLVSCINTVDVRTLPDGTKVTTTTRTSDPAAIAAGIKVAEIIAPIIIDMADRQRAELAAAKPAEAKPAAP